VTPQTSVDQGNRTASMLPFRILDATPAAPLLLTCEHASCAVPLEYDGLGLDEDELCEHIGWDIGAGRLTELLAADLGAPAVLGGVSRLVIDVNRDLADHDLIVEDAHGVPIPGNRALDGDERRRRIRDFHEPYHDAIDGLARRLKPRLLLSIHSFTPELNGRPRRFDVGVLFDTFAAEAERFGDALSAGGLEVRYNQPYSGLDGLIYSARRHGRTHGITYLELEVNNALLRSEAAIGRVARQVVPAVRALL